MDGRKEFGDLSPAERDQAARELLSKFWKTRWEADPAGRLVNEALAVAWQEFQSVSRRQNNQWEM